MSQENTNKQTPRPPFDPFVMCKAVTIVYEGDAQTVAHTRYLPINQCSAALVVSDSRAYTDQTIRLNTHCRECSDVLPVDAKFCISCGAPVC